MFLLNWLIGSPLRAAIGIILTLLAAAGIFVGVNVILAFTGGPGDCTPGGGLITVSIATAEEFKRKWNAFEATLDGGSPASVTFNESEVSSRAQQYIRDETDVEFQNVHVCIHDGFGEATGNLEAVLGLDARVKIKGNLDLSGDHPVARIDDIEIGDVPGLLTDLVQRWVEDAVEEALRDIELDHPYTPTLTQGQAQIDGAP